MAKLFNSCEKLRFKFTEEIIESFFNKIRFGSAHFAHRLSNVQFTLKTPSEHVD